MPSIKILHSIAQAPLELFLHNHSPFLSRTFWLALENSGAVSSERGWWPQHLLLLDDEGQALALLPLFIKNHNRGEYVFDHAWAQAYANNGLDYYPRLVSAVPFTPVTGPRVWLRAGVHLTDVLPFLLHGIQQIAEQLNASSWHGLFLQAEDVAAFQQSGMPLALRHGCQFLWTDQNFGDFDGFLATMTAKRRKSIKAERAKITRAGISCHFIEGADLNTDDWAFFYTCYARTYHIRGQRPYLNQAFFEQLGKDMPEHMTLQIAQHANGERLAAALFFKDDQTLYGRYWGAVADVDCLHFEVCYYQGIAYALAHKLRYFDPGTQGEHKLSRGFSPVYTQSLHWLHDERFMQAVLHYVEREQLGILDYYEEACAALPFKKLHPI